MFLTFIFSGVWPGPGKKWLKNAAFFWAKVAFPGEKVQIGARPLWKWYSDTIKLTKTPTHNLLRSQSMADGMWMADTQLTKLVEALYNMEDLSMVLEYHEAIRSVFCPFGRSSPKSLAELHI